MFSKNSWKYFWYFLFDTFFKIPLKIPSLKQASSFTLREEQIKLKHQKTVQDKQYHLQTKKQMYVS